MSKESNQFRSKIGLIAATVGSAVGLGNIWRFPAEVQAGGGAAFLLVYIICVAVLGIPVMVAEFSLGRAGRTDAIGAYAAVTPDHRRWKAVGMLSVLTAFLISAFYMVVTGWTLEYFTQSITGDLYNTDAATTATDTADYFSEKMQTYIGSGPRPWGFACSAIVINAIVLLMGVSKGIERASNILMPIMFILLLVFCGVALNLPDASRGLEFFLKPDFSKITPTTCLRALGQAFFSLSLGMGILVTYSGYYPPETRLTRTAIQVSALDLLVAVLMGIIIFPAISSFGLEDHGLTGTTLVFVTLPEIFMQLPGSAIWSTLFFLLLAIAAITSTVSITEVATRTLQDRLHLSRRSAVGILTLPLLALGSWCAIDSTVFNLLDFATANFMLPIAAIVLCLYMGWVAPKRLLRDQMTNLGHNRSRLFAPILFIIRYLAPPLIFLVLISPLL